MATARSNIGLCVQYILDYFRPVIEFRIGFIQQTENIQREMENIQGEINIDMIQYENLLSIVRSHDNLDSSQIENVNNLERPVIDGSSNSLIMLAMYLSLERLLSIRITHESNRKFDIKVNISENINNLTEKCECEICYEEYENKNFVKLNCGHKFCKDCIKKSLQNEKRAIPCCAYCRSEIKTFELKERSIKSYLNELII
jgi:hypothetical protein